MCRPVEGLCGGVPIAGLPIDRNIVRRPGPDLRRGRVQGGCGPGDRRQVPVRDLDQIGGVARLGQGLGDRHGDRLADVIDPLQRQNRMGRHVGLAAALAFHRGHAGDVPQAVGGQIGAGKDTQGAGGFFGRPGVDRQDVGVGMGAPDHHRPGRTLRRHIGAVTAPAGQKPAIFRPHGIPPWRSPPRRSKIARRADARKHEQSSGPPHLGAAVADS